MFVLVLIVVFFALAIGLLAYDQVRIARRRDIDRGFRLISQRASKRLQFRQPKQSDRDFSVEMASDPVAAKANGWSGNEVEAVKDRFRTRAAFAAHRDSELIAFERSNGTAIGTATFSASPLDPEHGRSIGIHVHADYRRKGYGREIMAAAIVLLQYEAAPIHVGTLVTNLGMQQIMTDLGYHPLPGTQPYHAPNGHTYDGYWYDCSPNTHPPAGLFEI